jgi:hypothetical protein
MYGQKNVKILLMKNSYCVGFSDTVRGTFTLPMKTKNPKHTLYQFHSEKKTKMLDYANLVSCLL